ncbi:MAG: YigZ family protein [Bacteroidota bacterium]|nr:YigZ family protein [Bacteroidota bacterium]
MTITGIYTLKDESKAVYKEKNSEFIAYTFPVVNIEEFNQKLAGLKKEFYDARHHCYALKLKNGTFKYSDDGEPNGTAGIRIYNAIEHFKLTDAAVIVIRYFGGVKLGVGPLGKAYYTAAESAINSAVIIEKNPYYKLYIQTDINMISPVFNLLARFNAHILEQDYIEGIGITLHLPYEKLDEFKKEIITLTRDKYKLTLDEEIIYL